MIIDKILNKAVVRNTPHTRIDSDYYLKVGKSSSSWWRSFLRFDLDDIDLYSSIGSAELEVYFYSCSHVQNITYISPFIIIENWNDCITWENQPMINRQLYDQPKRITNDGWYIWNVTEIVNMWFNGDLENFGLSFISNEDKCQSVSYIPLNQLYRPRLKIKTKRLSNVTLEDRRTYNFKEQLYITKDPVYTKPISALNKINTTFFIKNRKESEIFCQLEISPDGIDWYKEGEPVLISLNEIRPFVPTYFAHFYRLAIWAKCNCSYPVDVWCQAQT